MNWPTYVKAIFLYLHWGEAWLALDKQSTWNQRTHTAWTWLDQKYLDKYQTIEMLVRGNTRKALCWDGTREVSRDQEIKRVLMKEARVKKRQTRNEPQRGKVRGVCTLHCAVHRNEEAKSCVDPKIHLAGRAQRWSIACSPTEMLLKIWPRHWISLQLIKI